MSSTSDQFAAASARPAAAPAGVRHDAKVIGLISAAHFTSHVHLMLLPPIFGPVREAFGVSYIEIGVALTAYNVISAALQTPAGFLVDRIGPRAMLTGGLLLGAAAIAAAALLPGYWFFVISYAFLGVANTVYHPADYSILSATIDEKRIGKGGRAIKAENALKHVAGYTCFCDGSVRDFIKASLVTGKNFPRTSPLGPWMVTSDVIADPQRLELTTRLNGNVVQHDTTDHMIFDVATIIEYLSTVTWLEPGDIIATGTPDGVGMGRKPPLWMKGGDKVEVEISGIGTLGVNVVDE